MATPMEEFSLKYLDLLQIELHIQYVSSMVIFKHYYILWCLKYFQRSPKKQINIQLFVY